MLEINLKNGKHLLLPYFTNHSSATNFDPPKSSMGTLLQPDSSKNRSFFTKKWFIRSREVPQQHYLSWQHFGVMLLKNNICCFCCWKLLILSKSQKNRRHKWELTYEAMERQHLLLICCHRGPLPICCYFIILLKS